MLPPRDLPLPSSEHWKKQNPSSQVSSAGDDRASPRERTPTSHPKLESILYARVRGSDSSGGRGDAGAGTRVCGDTGEWEYAGLQGDTRVLFPLAGPEDRGRRVKRAGCSSTGLGGAQL